MLSSGLSAFLLGEERVGGLQPRQERGGKEREGNKGKPEHKKREEEEEGMNFVVLTSGLSALLLGEERVGGLQPRQERGGKEREGNEGKREQRKWEEEEEGMNFVVLTSGLPALLLGEERV